MNCCTVMVPESPVSCCANACGVTANRPANAPPNMSDMDRTEVARRVMPESYQRPRHAR